MKLARPFPSPSAAALAAALLAVLSASARAQPVELDPELVITDARAAYLEAPTAEELTVVLRPNGLSAAASGARRERYITRLDPGPAGGPRPARAVIELGSLKAFLEHGAVTVTHEADPGAAMVTAVPGPPSPAALAAVLPPVPWPQLALVDESDPDFTNPTPYTRGVRWLDALLDPSTNPPTATVTGRSQTGPITMTIHAETGRLLRLSAQIAADPPTMLDISVTPVDAVDPAAWGLPADGRQQVGSLNQLGSRTRALVRPGDLAPEITLLGPDLEQWSLSAAMIATERPRAVAVLLFRLPDEASELADVLDDAAVGRDALRAAASGPDELSSAAGAVMNLGSFTRGGFETLAREWAALREPARLGVDELRWTSSAQQTIDRLAPGSNAVLVVVGADRRVRAVVRLDGLADDDAAAAAIAGTVREAIAAPPAEAVPGS